MDQKTCQQCSKIFTKPQHQSTKQWSVRKFCSSYCSAKFRGAVPNTPESIERMRQTKLGSNKGAENHQWRGDDVGYRALHHWINNNLPKTGVCEFCKLRTKTDHANKSLEYKRDINDWYELCKSCHKLLDSRRQEAPEPKIKREEKLCPKCQTIKPKDEFGRNRQREDGLQSYCLDCYRSYRQKLYPNGFRNR